MKVLMINTINLEKNGVTTFILNSGKSLRKENVDITIAATNPLSKDINNFLRENHISYIKLPNRKKSQIKYIHYLVKIFKQNDYDVVHIHGNSTTMAIELFAAKIAHIPVRVAHSHNTLTEHPVINKVLRPFFNISVNGRVACNKEAGKWLFKNKPFLVIRNGIFFNKYTFALAKREKFRRKFNLKKTDILLGHVGFFNYQKNQEFFIDLMKQLDENYKLLLIGEGDLYKKFLHTIKKEKLEKRIITVGAVPNVSDYLAAMDIFLLPSRFEGQPFVIIEALASGLPCIISDKVPREIDITNNCNFVPLETIDWVSSVKTVKIEDRSLRSITNQKKLKQKGYDASDNGLVLKDYYRSLYYKE